MMTYLFLPMGSKVCTVIIISLLSLSFILNNPYSQIAVAQNLTGDPQNATKENLTTNATGPSVEPFGTSEDLSKSNSQFSSNAKKIAMELTKITPTDVSHYPLTSLSAKDISSVFVLLNPRNLAKVLLNLPQEDLMKVQQMLSPSAFNQTLDRLFEANRTQVQDRLSLISAPNLK
ncbi:MAG TPA: hypothetical protein VFR94_26005 [Nitrososphaeraceae archaeon]|nr:hypothetical protein [Nitrososphaeraceae archaeon]